MRAESTNRPTAAPTLIRRGIPLAGLHYLTALSRILI